MKKTIIGLSGVAVLALVFGIGTATASAQQSSDIRYQGANGQEIVVRNNLEPQNNSQEKSAFQDNVSVGDVIDKDSGETVFAINEDGSYITFTP